MAAKRREQQEGRKGGGGGEAMGEPGDSVSIDMEMIPFGSQVCWVFPSSSCSPVSVIVFFYLRPEFLSAGRIARLVSMCRSSWWRRVQGRFWCPSAEIKRGRP